MLVQEIREYDEIVGRMDQYLKQLKKESQPAEITKIMSLIHELEWVIKQRIK
jgi:hypothetical protein